jgi:hypothetical protein
MFRCIHALFSNLQGHKPEAKNSVIHNDDVSDWIINPMVEVQ